MRYFKKLICACVAFLCILPKVHAYEQKKYSLDTFLSNRLSLAHFVPTANTQSDTIQKVGGEIKNIPYVQQLFGKNILLLSFFVPPTQTDGLFPARYFVTYPSGKVESVAFSGSFTSSGGSLIPGEQVFLKIPLSQNGRHKISLFDRYGFSILGTNYQFGDSAMEVQKEYNEDTNQSPFHRINTLRTKIGEKKLQESHLLQKIANKKIDDMIQKKYFGHEDIKGVSLIKNMAQTSNMMLGENLARGSEKNILQQKLEESGAHRYNMQFSEWNKIGVAIRKGPDNLWYMVQIFSK